MVPAALYKPLKSPNLVDYPVYVPESGYITELGGMVDRLSVLGGIQCIYQIGSVSAPGISDIDIFVVFDDGASTDINPLSELSEGGRYLFNHGPFAATRSQMAGVQRYTFFHNYRLVWGKENLPAADQTSPEEERELKYQTAMEYLLKMYISMTVERTFRIIKVRGLLLHIKALLYDLEFLQVSDGPLFDELTQIVDWRNNWFEKMPGRQTLIEWHDRCYRFLGEFLAERLAVKRLYFPGKDQYEISKNIILAGSDEFCTSHSGLVLPPRFGGSSRRYFNIQYRFNRFRFELPITGTAASGIISERYSFMVDVQQHHKKKLPYFLLPGSSLAIF